MILLVFQSDHFDILQKSQKSAFWNLKPRPGWCESLIKDPIPVTRCYEFLKKIQYLDTSWNVQKLMPT
jgi:hypothetical protein